MIAATASGMTMSMELGVLVVQKVVFTDAAADI